MSETTEIQPLRIGPFILAMIGGPLIVTIVTFWAIIPAYALVLGGIPYLVIGTPIALWMALSGPVTVERSIVWAGATILAITLPIALFAAFAGSADGVGGVLIIGLVCAIFAMAWAATTGWLYITLTKPKPPEGQVP